MTYVHTFKIVEKIRGSCLYDKHFITNSTIEFDHRGILYIKKFEAGDFKSQTEMS